MEANRQGFLAHLYDLPEEEGDSPLKPYRSVKSFNGAAKSLPEYDVSNSTPNGNELSIYPVQMPGIQSAKSNIASGLPKNNIQPKDFHLNVRSQAESEIPEQTTRRQVVLVDSEELVELCDRMIKIPERASLVSSLIQAYGLHRYLRVEKPRAASMEDMMEFHTQDYLEFLQKISSQDDEDKYDEEAQEFGIGYDCTAHKGVYEYTALVCGATLTAAQSLINNTCDVAINWYGGWHHGKKDSAAGFCYTNDVVLGIVRLRQKFTRVLYVDLDLHHGDGVEDAFCATNKVMTVSVHKYASGFYPGTGSVHDIGCFKGRYYSVNIPLMDGVGDAAFATLVSRTLVKVRDQYQPEVIVCQCGADGLVGDPMESFNLTLRGLGKCVYTLLSWKLPMMLLGGGGYNHPNTARCWTYLTSIAVEKKLPTDIPEHQHLMEYGPDYDLQITAGNQKDQNSPEYLQGVYSQIAYNLSQIPKH